MFRFGCAESSLMCTDFSSYRQRGLLFTELVGFSVQWLLLWSAGALGLQWLWPAISVAPRRVGSSWIGDRTCVSRNGRRILNHWTTKEALA